MRFLQNGSVCLPSGLDCYSKNVTLSQDDCSILPCTGIYADYVKHNAEDLLMDEHVLDRYKEYKAGFKYNKGDEQAEAEVVPSSSLVEVEVGVEVDELRCN